MKAPVDMTPRAIEARLESCSRQSVLDFAPARRVEMTAAAVEARLAECAEMSELCLALGRSRS